MPAETIPISDHDRELLEQVRAMRGLDSIEQAAEWLARSGLRRAAEQATGRRRRLLQLVHPARELP